jgi:hypothetical protein
MLSIRLYLVLGTAATVLLGCGSSVPSSAPSSAHPALYYVYTSSTSAMSLDATDHYCSLAEAIASVNAGFPRYDCQNQDPTADAQTIELREGPDMPFSQHHFTVTSFTINGTSAPIRIKGSGAFIDSTGTSAFDVRPGSSMFVQGVTMTYTGGTSEGRMIENYGTLSIDGVSFLNGDVTSQTSGLGGAIYNEGTITDVKDSLLQGNKAKLGGAIYNKDGTISNLNAVISGNSATMAGGGIYNMNTVADPFGDAKASITGRATTITGNSAKAGGGIFNRGLFEMQATSITFNTASGTGSGETFASGESCDGAGGGILGASSPTISADSRLRSGSALSDNTASGLGGGVYNTGRMVLDGTDIARNRAMSGAAIYTAFVSTSYCEVQYNADLEPSSIVGNQATAGYSIVDGTGMICLFEDDILIPASGNSAPYCAPSSIAGDAEGPPPHGCPQH